MPILLVVTTDLDVMDVYLRPYLQTYLPFVLAVPFATLALLLASTLRAVNRTLGSVLVASYSMNAMIIAAGVAVSLRSEERLLVLSWAFFHRQPAGGVDGGAAHALCIQGTHGLLAAQSYCRRVA